MKTPFFLVMGLAFGFLISRAGVGDYDTVQGMFLLTDFQLYGVIGVSIAVLIPGLWLAKRRARTLSGETFTVEPKSLNRGTVLGSVLFGIGWSMTGMCPGPMFVDIGEGKLYGLVALAGVLVGTTLLGVTHERLSGPLGLTSVGGPLSPGG